jgi:hypothetical protein
MERMANYFSDYFHFILLGGYRGERCFSLRELRGLQELLLGKFLACGKGWNWGLRKFYTTYKVLCVKESNWDKAKRMYLAGNPWKTIASETKLNQTTLQTRASREDWTKFRKGMRDIVPKENQSLESLSILVRNRLASDAVSTLERIDNYDLADIKDESTREQILGSLSKRSALVFGWSESGESPSVSINLLGSMPDKMFHVEQSRARED